MRHLPVRGELSARDADQARRRVPHRILAGGIPRAPSPLADERPHPGPCRQHVVMAEILSGKTVLDHLEYLVDVGPGGTRPVQWPIVLRVRRAHVHVVKPSHGESALAVGGPQERRSGYGEPFGPQQNVDALAGDERVLRRYRPLGQNFPAPGPGGIHRDACCHVNHSPLESVGHLAPDHSTLFHPQLAGPGVVDHQRSMLSRRLGVLQGETGVVGDVLEVTDPSLEPLAESRELLADLFGGEVRVFVLSVGAGQVIEDGQPGSNLHEALTFEDRVHECQGMHEVRGDSAQNLPFLSRLPHKEEVPVLQVPEPTVHDLRRAAGRAEPEVLLLHEADGPAPESRVTSDPAPCDAAADDQEVETLPAQLSQGLPTTRSAR